MTPTSAALFITPEWVYRYVTRLFLRAGGLMAAHSGVGAAVAGFVRSVGSYPALGLLVEQGGRTQTAAQDPWGELSLYDFIRAYVVQAGVAPIGSFESILRHRQLRSDWVFALGLVAWQLPAADTGVMGHPTPLLPAHLLMWASSALEMTYRIRYHALDRKVRKIVKNRYRYVRTYVCVRDVQRIRFGLRLLPLGVLLCTDRRWVGRLTQLLAGLVQQPEASILRQLRKQHHQTALTALGLV